MIRKKLFFSLTQEAMFLIKTFYLLPAGIKRIVFYHRLNDEKNIKSKG